MSHPLPRRTVTSYAIGIGPAAMLGLPFSVYLPPYVAAGGVVPVALVGLIFALSTLWDGIVDPLIGTMIDRKSKGDAPHRRWMRIAALPIAVLLPLLAIGGDDIGFWLLLPLLLLFYSSHSLYDVAHLSWGAALAQNPDDSVRLFGNRQFAEKIILVLAFALPAAAQGLMPDIDLQGRVLAYASLVIIVLPVALLAIARLPGRPVVPEPGIGWKAEYLDGLAACLQGGKKVKVGGSMAANPLSCCAGYHTLLEIERTNACEKAGKAGDRITKGLNQLIDRYELPFVAFNQGSICHLEAAGTLYVKIKLLKIKSVLAEINERKKLMEEYGAAYLAEGIVTLAGSRLYCSMADTDEVIDDALNRFENVFKNVRKH